MRCTEQFAWGNILEEMKDMNATPELGEIFWRR